MARTPEYVSRIAKIHEPEITSDFIVKRIVDDGFDQWYEWLDRGPYDRTWGFTRHIATRFKTVEEAKAAMEEWRRQDLAFCPTR